LEEGEVNKKNRYGNDFLNNLQLQNDLFTSD